MDGWTTRQGGTTLEVHAVYNNLYPIKSSFGYREVEYHYEVRELMLPYVSRWQLSTVQPPDYPVTRRYEVKYGLHITFSVAGSFGSFNILYFIINLTAAFALLTSATTVID